MIYVRASLHNNEGNYSAAAAQLESLDKHSYNKIKKQEKMVSNFYLPDHWRVVCYEVLQPF